MDFSLYFVVSAYIVNDYFFFAIYRERIIGSFVNEHGFDRWTFFQRLVDRILQFDCFSTAKSLVGRKNHLALSF